MNPMLENIRQQLEELNEYCTYLEKENRMLETTVEKQEKIITKLKKKLDGKSTSVQSS
jgi:predicted RNase H-like nuclease (RuvC/YqgF family)